MRAQSAALGIAAAAAFSSAATALPCAETLLGKTEISEITCTVSDKTSNPLARDEQGEPLADAAQHHSQPAVDKSPLSLDVTEAADGENAEAADSENFARRDIKITNLQATMTSNKYIAGRLPAAGETTPVDDLISLSGLSVDQDAAAHPEAKADRGRSRHSAKAAGKRIRHKPSRPMVSATATLGLRSHRRREWRVPP